MEKCCLTCKKIKPKTNEFWRFDKRRQEPYGSCLECINLRRSLHRKVKRAGIYGTDCDIKKRVKNKSLNKDLIETERLRLILLDRIKNNSHLIMFENKMMCKVCNETSEIIMPITFPLFKQSIKAFTEIHKHD